MKKTVNVIILSMGCLLTASAHAHFPLMNCWFEGPIVACHAGYSDGSSAVDYSVKLYDYDDNLLFNISTDKRAIAEFIKPEGEFYVLFDAGHENPVEVDSVEIVER